MYYRMRRRNEYGFTYLEILVVLLVIGVLLTISISAYVNLRANSMDQRRKTDLEQLRSALEQYRSVNNAYPTPGASPGLSFGTDSLEDATHTYMATIPQDPESPRRTYFYTTVGDDYTLATELTRAEDLACQSSPGGDSCGQEGSGFGCNYCLGSYGKK